MKIKVSASFGGKLPVGDYANMSPSFYAELDYETTTPNLLDLIDSEQKRLHEICYRNFKPVADMARLEKIKNDFKSFRFYKTEFGEYPSVTTIIDPEFKSYVADEDLKLAISEGNIHHAQAHHFIETGKWADPKDIDGTGPDLLALKGHVLTEWDFPSFLEKYPMTNMNNGRPVFNHKEKYAGTPDGTCIYPRGGIKGNPLVKTIFDFKRTAIKEKAFLQMSAYARADGLQDTWQMMIIPTGSDTAQGFSKPIISSAIDKFYEVFLDKRKQFLAT